MFDKLIFKSEFSCGKLNPDQWTLEAGGFGYGNEEAQVYTDNSKNVRIENGLLVIEAHKEHEAQNDYTSGKITSYGKFSFQYGKVIVRAKIPYGKGTWPAIWLLPDTFKTGKYKWPHCGEIDMMEHVGRNKDEIHFSLHTEKYNHSKNTQYTYSNLVNGITKRMANYTMIWTKEKFEFLIDDIKYAVFTKGSDGKSTDFSGWPFDQPYYLILNLAIGGFWGGAIDDSIFPVRMEVESIEIYSD